MKKFKWLSLVVLAVSVAVFTVYSVGSWREKEDQAPAITMEETELYVSVTDDDAVLLQGVTAYDDMDGDVTGSLIVESLSDFVDENTRYVNYAAFDSNHHVAKASRKIIYTDYQPTRVSITAPLRFAAVTSGTKELLGNVYAEDCLDGDISDQVVIANDTSVNVNNPGEYKVNLTVTNSAGDQAVIPVTITMYTNAEESAAPKIQLSQYLVYTTVGKAMNPLDFITNPVDSYEGYVINDPTDYQTPGTYEIEYQLSDGKGHVGKAHLVVVVEEE